MKSVLALLVVGALMGAAVALDSAHSHDAEFNTHDADALEVQFDAEEESGMEVESADALNTEAELVDSAEAAATDSVEFEDAADADADADAADADTAESEQSDTLFDEENAADALDSDEADEALDNAENAEAQKGAQNVEQGFKSLTSSDVSLAVDDMAGLEARKCTPPKTISCPDGTLAFTRITRAPDYNGCGASGAVVFTDAVIGGQFSPCCNNHDICYGSPRATKDACDSAFYSCMQDVCKSDVICKGKAWVYYQAVSVGGCTPWVNARLQKGCLTGPNAAANPKGNAPTKATPAQTKAAAHFFAAAENSAAAPAAGAAAAKRVAVAKPKKKL